MLKTSISNISKCNARSTSQVWIVWSTVQEMSTLQCYDFQWQAHLVLVTNSHVHNVKAAIAALSQNIYGIKDYRV